MTQNNKFIRFIKAAWEYIKHAKTELIVLVALLAADLITKGIVSGNMYVGESIEIIPNLLYIQYARNTKAAFGSAFGLENILGDNAIRIIFLVITVLAVGVFAYLLYRLRARHVLMRVSIAMIIAGAIGNFVDRLVYRYVRDMIAVRFLGCDLPLLGKTFPIFNVADMGLTVGVILFLIYFIAIYKEPKPASPVETATEIDRSLIDGEEAKNTPASDENPDTEIKVPDSAENTAAAPVADETQERAEEREE